MITVNGEPIDPSLIEEAFHRIKADAESQSEASCCERDEEFQKQAEDEVIEGILLAQEAEKQVPEPESDEIREAFEKSLRKWRENGASWDTIEAQRDQLRNEVIAKMRMERFTKRIFKQLPELDEQSLRDWHEAHPEIFNVQARAKVTHLVRFPRENAEEEYSKLVKVRKEALDGADFKELAKKHTAREDGDTDLGWIEHNRMTHPIETMIFSLRVGEISPIFFFDQGYHIVCIEELETAQMKPYEEVADKVKELATASQRRKALKIVAKELKKKAIIERPEVAAQEA